MSKHTSSFKPYLDENFTSIKDILHNRRCLKIKQSDNLKSAVAAMRREQTGAAGVVDENDRFIGLLTEQEVLRRLFNTEDTRSMNEMMLKDIDQLTVEDVMIIGPAVLVDDMPVDEAFDIITKRGFRFMPVVTRGQGYQLAGIVSERELFMRAHAYMKKIKAELEQKDTMLNYFMHHEPYGSGYSSS